MRSEFLRSAAALMSVGILAAGCSSDVIMQEPEKPLEKDSRFYINVAITNPGEQSTRAESEYDYHLGTEAEQKIESILFVFYNSANKYVGDTHVTINGNKGTIKGSGETVEVSTDKYNDSEGNPVTGVQGDNTTAIMNLIVPVSVGAGSLKPVKVIAYVNPTVQAAKDNDVKRSLEQALGITRELDEVKPCTNPAHPHSGFTMTNSVYYRNGTASAPAEGEEEETVADDPSRPAISVSIPSGYLVSTPEEATAAKTITIPVERVVAKVSLSKSDEDIEQKLNVLDHAYKTVGTGDDATPIEYTLNFEILGWGLSNVERGSFLIKNFRSGGNVQPSQFSSWFSMTNMNKATAEEKFKTMTDWNYAPSDDGSALWYSKGYRSFWACSPTYFLNDDTAQYPSFSDEYSDRESEAEDEEYSGEKFNLIYRSFNDIYDTDKSAAGSFGEAVGNSLYTLEHTMQETVVSKYQKRAVTCALVVGQYTLTSNNDHDGEEQGQKTFFVLNGVKATGETGSWIIPDEESLYSRVLSSGLNTVLYTKNATTGAYEKVIWNKDTYGADFEIVHPDKVTTSRYTTGAENETYTPNYTPNRYVSVQLKSGVAADKYYLLKGDGQYYSVKGTNGATLTEANRALYGILSVEKYHNGYAFFAVPIEHIWGKDKKKMGETDFNPALGQYGVVRNHFYQLVIKGIEGIGTGIGDPDSPIVPNVEEEKYYVRTELRVMPWRLMPAQEVILMP